MRPSIKKLRQRLGMNQVEFGKAIGRSWISVAQYEAGKRITPEVRETIIHLAEKHGLQDLVEDLIQELEERPPDEGYVPVLQKVPKPHKNKLHAMLDEILTRGDPEAISAVTKNIQVFYDYVRHRRPGRK